MIRRIEFGSGACSFCHTKRTTGDRTYRTRRRNHTNPVIARIGDINIARGIQGHSSWVVELSVNSIAIRRT